MFYNFNKVGKGINPNEPKKTGMAWFYDVLWREFWAMAWLNLMFLLYSVPIFTIGAAYSAMNTVLLRMVRDQPVDAVRDFRDEFRKNFKQSTVVFFIQVVVVVVLAVNIKFYQTVNPALAVFVGVVALLLAMANLYVTPVMVSVDLKIRHIFKNSFLLLFLNTKYSLFAVFYWVIGVFLHAWYAPISFLSLMTFGIVLMTYINCFLTFYGIEKFCYPKDEEEEEEKPVSMPEPVTPLVKRDDLTPEEELALLEAEESKLKEEILAEENKVD